MMVRRHLYSLMRSCAASVALAITIVLSVGMPHPASANVDYPPGVFTLSLDLSTAPPGALVVASVNGAVCGVPMELRILGTDITVVLTSPSTPAGGSCTATGSFNAPPTPGNYTAQAVELAGQRRTATAVLSVVAATTTTTGTGGTLPRTGSDILRVTGGAVAVLVTGFFVVLAARHRRAATSQ